MISTYQGHWLDSNHSTFQSLIGILVDFNAETSESTDESRELFQSLIGILVDFNRELLPLVLVGQLFQSLIGILVDFNPNLKNHTIVFCEVSIPDRDFS